MHCWVIVPENWEPRWQGLRLKVKPYVPDFKTAFEHFCIHTGGRGVIDEVSTCMLPTQTCKPHDAIVCLLMILHNLHLKTCIEDACPVWTC